MKIKAFDSVCIWSEDSDKLAKWYEEKLDLKVDSRIDLPNDKGVSFIINGVLLFIGYHDQVHRQSKDPYRIMPGFVVDSVDKVYEELIAKGVTFIRKPSWSPDNTYKAATIVDSEGNIIQFFSDYKS
jgi:predicted enzyme related to lactoylglutathione lyase